VVALWPEQNGGHPTIAYQTVFAVNLALQVAWFLLPSRASKTPLFLAHTIHWRPVARTQCLAAAGSYDRAIDRWMARIAAAREEAADWRAAAIASALFALALSASFTQAIAAQRMAGVHVVQLPDRLQRGLLFETEATQHWSGDRTPMAVTTARMAPVVDDFDFGVANR
jgi:hypothetical protein